MSYSPHTAWIGEDGKHTRVFRPDGLNRQSGTKKNETIRHQSEQALKKKQTRKRRQQKEKKRLKITNPKG